MANNMIACRKSFTDTLLELARQDKDIVAVTTDARGSVTLGDFAKELPAQYWPREIRNATLAHPLV